jgi:hypothetical protein
MSEQPYCFDPYQGCPALSFLEKRLDTLDESVKRIVELLTNQAVQGQQISVQQQMIKEHTEALSAGRDRFNNMDLRVAQLAGTCDGLKNFKSWVVTSGIALVLSLTGLVYNVYISKIP